MSGHDKPIVGQEVAPGSYHQGYEDVASRGIIAVESAEKRPIWDIAPTLLGASKTVVRVATTEVTSKALAEAGMAKRSTARASPEIEKLKAANLAYYKALSARDIRAMAQVWTCAANNILIAPPENPHEHVGWTAIKRNWQRYWPTFDQFSVSMKVNKINVSGPVAWVHGIERTRRRKTTGEVSSSRNFGTNIFVNCNGHWLMVFHQAAEIPRKS